MPVLSPCAASASPRTIFTATRMEGLPPASIPTILSSAPAPPNPDCCFRGAICNIAQPFMVYLSKIYTKTGDDGETGLGDGSRVSKDHARIVAVGGVDELNAAIGLTLASTNELDSEIVTLLRGIQND